MQFFIISEKLCFEQVTVSFCSMFFLFSASKEYKDKKVKALRIIIVISQHVRCFDCWEIRDQIMQFLSSSVVS